jgi:LAO/AO transport system kinase
VVNKSDLPNSDLLARQLASIVDAAPGERRTPIVRTSGAMGDGIGDLADALASHRAEIERSGAREEHRRAQARHQVLALARQRLIDRLITTREDDGRLERLVEQVAARELDPHSAADALIGD